MVPPPPSPLRLSATLAVALASLALSCLPSPPGARIPPPPDRWVSDGVGLLSPDTRLSLDRRLEQLERDTGHQVVVWIGRSTSGVPIEDWAARTFQAWGVGRKGLDDGAVLFVLTDDRRARLEVGYGLEERVPDAVAHRIVQERVVAGLRSGDPDRALAGAVDDLTAAITGAPGTAARAPPPVARQPQSRPVPGTAQLVLWAIVGVFFLVLLATHPSLALWLLFNVASGGRGGGGGGRGGFSGGGGRSGGGGASGSW